MIKQAAGIAAFTLFGWMLTDPSFLISLTKEGNNFYIGLLVFVGVATFTLVIAFLGCCGALKESQCMLVSVSFVRSDTLLLKPTSTICKTKVDLVVYVIRPFFHCFNWKLFLCSLYLQFFCFLLIVLVAEIATGVYAYMNQAELMKMVRESVKHTVREEYGEFQSKTLAFDAFHKHVSIISRPFTVWNRTGQLYYYWFIWK